MKDILIIAIRNENLVENFKILYKNALSISQNIGGEIYCLLIGDEEDAIAISCFKMNKIFYSNLKELNDEYYLSHFLKEFLKDKKISYLLFSDDKKSKTIAAKTSAILNIGLISDVCEIKFDKNEIIAIKPALGGNSYCEIYSRSEIKALTIKNEKIPIEINDILSPIEELKIEIEKTPKTIILSKAKKENTNIPIEKAKTVIGVGRGVKKEDLSLIYEIAKKLNAAIGFTRPLIYDGWSSNENQIGISGKTLNCDLYIAIGISGKVYHTNALKQVKTIIAINNDPKAQIRGISNYFLNSDYKAALIKIKECF
jgi:electron transfer flavoprotein alpha subunit